MFSYKILLILVISINNFIDGQRENLDWWQKTVLYQIYPRSFQDSNGDGIGDLKGVEEASHYLVETGIEAVWFSPIFKSPMADMGYDISDYKEIDPIFGTMDDFDSLQKTLKSKDIKLILDFVPNHTSDEHDWFKKSVKKIDPYTDYYVWKTPKYWMNETTPVPPNNWMSLFGGPAWKYVPERKEFYLHQFAVKQPDLNYRSKKLVEEMKNVVRFWLDKGIDGFRMDAVSFIFEHKSFRDEPVTSDYNGPLSYESLNHIYTTNQPETFNILSEFREVLDSYKEKDDHTRLMLTEAGAGNEIRVLMKYFGGSSSPISHMPFNFVLLWGLNDTSNAEDFSKSIYKWLDNLPDGQWSNWVLGNHDNPRIASRFGSEQVDSMNMLLLLLPGTGVTYNGEEIGMEDTSVRWEQTTDIAGLNAGPKLYQKYSRDPERTPFQWNAHIHAGFSNKRENCWLPVNPNYYVLNHEFQKNISRSHYNVYKSLVKLRSNDILRYGDLKIYVVSKWIFAFKRSLSDQDIFLVVLNLNNVEEYVNLNSKIKDLPEYLYVYLPSINSEHDRDDKLNTNSEFIMRPKSAIVLSGAQSSHQKSAGKRITAGPLVLFLTIFKYLLSC